VIVNDVFEENRKCPLEEGDYIKLFPPMAGG